MEAHAPASWGEHPWPTAAPAAGHWQVASPPVSRQACAGAHATGAEANQQPAALPVSWAQVAMASPSSQ